MIDTTYYHVSINNIPGSNTSAGFVDSKKIEYYTTAVPPTTDSQNKERANLRYVKIIDDLQVVANMYISNIVANGASSSTAPTTFAFDLAVERGDSVLMTADELSNGVVLTGNACIKRCIARALSLTYTVDTEMRWDNHLFFMVGNITVGTLGNVSSIESSITVSKIA